MDRILKQFGIEKIKNVVKNSTSFADVTRNLELNVKDINIKKNVERSIKRLGLSTEHFDSIKRLKESKIRYDKEKLEVLIKKCKTYSEVLLELDILPISTNYRTLNKYIKLYNIDDENIRNKKLKWSKENLELVIKNSNSSSEVLQKMGNRLIITNFTNLKKYILLYEIDSSNLIDIEKIYSNKKISLDKILIENSTYSRKSLKKRLYDTGLKERKCELCNQDENWNGKKMSLILDHKNGVYNDNRLENLRIVCPNCNATLDTHAGKNIKKKIKPEKIKEDLRLGYNISRRKVERPSLDILKEEICSLGLEGTGRKYKVTGNSIKKWVKTYEKYGN